MTPEERTTLARIERKLMIGFTVVCVWLLLLTGAVLGQPATFHLGQTDVAAASTARDYIAQHKTPFSVRVLWLQNTSARLVAGARYVPNATISRTDRGVTLPEFDDGHFVAVDLLQMSRNFAEFVELAGLFEAFADLDFYGHERNQLVEALVVASPCTLEAGGKVLCSVPAGFQVNAGDGNSPWVAMSFAGHSGYVRRSQLKLVKIAPFAAHLAAEMLEIQALTGSRAAFLRADDFVRLAYSQVDEGQYYALLGIDGLDLKGVMAKYGAPVAELDQFNPFNWGAIETSRVANERAYVLAPAINAAPGRSRNFFGLTFDFRNDNRADDPLGNLFFFVNSSSAGIFDQRFDAGEGIFILPNGFPVGILYNGQGALQDVAPQEIATDPLDRTVHHQLQAGISCHRCHDTWWKDAGNSIRWRINNGLDRGGIYGINDPRFAGQTQEQVFGKLVGAYGATINPTLDESRRIIASQIAGTCGISAHEAIDGVTELYAAASYGDQELASDNWSVSPRLVLAKHGIEIEGEPTALELRAAFDKYFPPPDIASGIIEFPEVSGWRKFDFPSETNLDSPQPSMEHLRRSYSYLASIRDFRSLEGPRQASARPPVVEGGE